MDFDSSDSILPLLIGNDTGKKGRLARTVTFYGLLAASVKITQDWINRGKNKLRYVLTVNQDDPLFPYIHDWILNNLTQDKQKSLIVTSSNTDKKLKLFYSGQRSQYIHYNNQKIGVAVILEEAKDQDKNSFSTGGAIKTSFMRPRFEVHFSVYSAKGKEAVIDLLTELCKDHLGDKQETSYLFTPTTWNEWRRRNSYLSRSLDSIYLAGDIKETVVNDVQRFLDSEHIYKELGVPYHRGYIFHGVPGTGKSSLVKALGEHFKMNVYYAPLSDMKKDAEFTQLITEINDRAILLLEDIDILKSSNDRTKTKNASKSGLSLAGLLNALDGVITPHGLIIIMTTNNIESLDPALIRTGRADLILHLDYMQDEQLEALASAIGIKNTKFDSINSLEIPPSDFVQAVLPYIYSGDKAMVEAIQEVINKAKKKESKSFVEYTLEKSNHHA